MIAARAAVVVPVTPPEAFRLFVDEIGLWWRPHTPYWNDAERGLYLRIEPGVGGRFVEVHDAETDTGFEIGRVTAWEPGERLGLTWTQAGWPEGEATDVAIASAPVAGGTRVSLEHTGFDRVGADGARADYEAGWTDILGWYNERARAGART